MQQGKTATNQIVRIAIIGISLLVVALLPNRFLFDNSQFVCPHYYLLGFQCPFCGMLRAVNLFTHLRIGLAVKYNFVVIFLPVYFLLDIVTLFARQERWLRLKKIVVISMMAAFTVLYVIRMLTHWGCC